MKERKKKTDGTLNIQKAKMQGMNKTGTDGPKTLTKFQYLVLIIYIRILISYQGKQQMRCSWENTQAVLIAFLDILRSVGVFAYLSCLQFLLKMLTDRFSFSRKTK